MKKVVFLKLVLFISFFSVFTGMAQANWIKTYSNNEYIWHSAITKTFDGNLIVAGHLSGTSPENDHGALFAKLDSNGDIIWQRKLGLANGYAAKCVLETSDHYFIVAGHDPNYGWIFKFDPDGNVLWQRSYGGNNSLRSIEDIKETSDGGYIVTGVKSSHPDHIFCGIMKLDSNGNVQWRRGASNPNSGRGYSVHETSDGGYVVAAGSYQNAPWIIKFNAEGDTVWQKRYEIGSIGDARSIYPTSDGGFVVRGQQ